MERFIGPLKRPVKLRPTAVSLAGLPKAIEKSRKTWPIKWADAFDRIVKVIEAGHCSNRAYIQRGRSWAYVTEPIVDLAYFQQQFVQNQFDFVYILEARPEAKAPFEDVAFLVGAFDAAEDSAGRPDGLYLDIVCAKRGYGPAILKAFLNANVDKDIRLSALPTVIGLYSKPDFGFEYRSGCGSSAAHKPFRPAKSLLDGVRSAVRHEDPKRRTDTVPKAFADKATATLMQQLQYHGLNVNRSSPGCRATALAAQKANWGNLKQARLLYERQCAVDGYTMFKCAEKGAAKKGSKRR